MEKMLNGLDRLFEFSKKEYERKVKRCFTSQLTIAHPYISIYIYMEDLLRNKKYIYMEE